MKKIALSLKNEPMRILFFVLSLFITLEAKGKPLPREVLALYDSHHPEKKPEYTPLHQKAEVILNHLGLKVRYHDLQEGLPSDESLQEVRAIISWFSVEGIPDSEEYCHWLSSQMQNGKKYLLLGEVGATIDSKAHKKTSSHSLDLIFKNLGIQWDSKRVTRKLETHSLLGFEAPYESHYTLQKVLPQAKNTPFITLEGGVVGGTFNSKGAYVATPFLTTTYEGSEAWVLDPFSFFSKALGIEGSPQFDTTTLLGTRLYYAEIQATGLKTPSQVEPAFSGDVIATSIIETYPLPFTVGLISSENYEDPDTKKLFERLISFSSVEIASQTHSYPLVWAKKRSLFSVPHYSNSDCHCQKDWNTFLEKETVGSIQLLNQKLPENKKITLLLWSGDCHPPVSALVFLHKEQWHNLNGMGSKLDATHPSYCYVTPLGRNIGPLTQIYSSIADMSYYPKGHYDDVIETFKRTEYPQNTHSYPRRMAPLHVSIHFDAGETKECLQSIQRVLDYCTQTNKYPLFASMYCSIVEDFQKGHIKQLSENSWEISDYGECQTLRVDRICYPDLRKSRGILGFKEWEGVTYLHLQKGEKARLVLTDKKPLKPYVESGTSKIDKLKIAASSIHFDTLGLGESAFTFSNLYPNQNYRIYLDQKEAFDIETTPEGKLSFSFSLWGDHHIDCQRL